MNEASGLLVVDKPRGPTSHDVVAGARRLYRTRRVGHAGTLDPMATGVLVLLVGEATKLSPYLTLDRKSYLATISFGTSTDTLDAEGQVVASARVDQGAVSGPALDRALRIERERELQLPPQFSALKVAGVSAHRAARKGQHVDLPPRPVGVERLELTHAADTELGLSLTVSKGYYVRALCRDLCASLGVEGHLAALRRTASGSLDLEMSVPWPATTPPPLLSIAEAANRCLPAATLTEDGVRRARLGQRLTPDHFMKLPSAPGAAAWLSESGELVSVGEPTPEGGFSVRRGFRPA